ncbi:hypothetical protein NW759_014995 [Fusarium solani]|nr:hypothetical protein NW759_014995 [Fusarium solani]
MSSVNSINIPPSKSTVQVSIIDTTFNGKVPTAPFMGPPIKGFHTWYPVAYSFLVTHKDPSGSDRNVIFDLGSPTDMVNDFPPVIAESIKDLVAGVEGGHLTATKNVSEILAESGFALENIESVIWSHAHSDHSGRPSLFPSSTSLIVGPGLKEAYFPGWPACQDSPVLGREFEGREVTELGLGRFDLELGGLKAMDYFGDGSFYLCSAPGHAVGHINALARTSEDTFIYFAADSVHHPAELRPHSGALMPTSVHLPGNHHCCSSRPFRDVHPANDFSRVPPHYHAAMDAPHGGPENTPFQLPSETADGWTLAAELQAARDTVKAVQRFDASPDILVVSAHDTSLHPILDYFPKVANDWKRKGWKERGQWGFLRELEGATKLHGQE